MDTSRNDTACPGAQSGNADASRHDAECPNAEDIVSALMRAPLFAGIDPGQATAMLTCLNARTRTYQAHEFIERAGSTITRIGVLLDGEVEVIDEDFWGNRNINEHIGAPGVFGGAYACVPGSRMRVSVVAVSPCTVVFLDAGKISAPCQHACAFHQQLIHNLLMQMARKNLALTARMAYTSQRTTRDKLLAYLSDQAAQHGSDRFDIPLDRQQLADFLSVNRSAMSAELSALRREGVIDFRKNHFVLKPRQP